MNTLALSAFAAVLTLAPLTGVAAEAADGARLAADHGCLNCHFEGTHGMPSLKALGERSLKRGGEPGPIADHLLEEMLEKDAIHSHTFISEARARAVLTWVAQGAK